MKLGMSFRKKEETIEEMIRATDRVHVTKAMAENIAEVMRKEINCILVEISKVVCETIPLDVEGKKQWRNRTPSEIMDEIHRISELLGLDEL